MAHHGVLVEIELCGVRDPGYEVIRDADQCEVAGLFSSAVLFVLADRGDATHVCDTRHPGLVDRDGLAIAGHPSRVV